MSVAYILICLLILVNSFKQIPQAFVLIIKSAFNPTAAFGGFLGVLVVLAIGIGIARGVFSK